MRPLRPMDADLALPLEASQLLRSIERAFGQSFALLECSNGKVLRPARTAFRSTCTREFRPANKSPSAGCRKFSTKFRRC